jgi:hypothetical protein
VLLFVSLYGAYHMMLPQGFDVNAPGIARWRVEGRWVNPDGVMEARKGLNPILFLLWAVSFVGLCAASICAVLTVQETGLILPLLLLAGLVLAGLAGIRRVLYPPLQHDKGLDLLKDQATYRATYSHFSTAQLEVLLEQPSDLVPGAADLITEELTRRQANSLSTPSHHRES